MDNNKPLETSFIHIIELIKSSRERAIRAVNNELIMLYWEVGKYISNKVQKAQWGDKIVYQLADYIQNNEPETKGFTRRNLYRMKQFYETYIDSEIVSTLLAQIPWSSHLHILSKTKSFEEKEFYIKLAIKERLSVRELARQIDSGYFERAMLSSENVSSALAQIHKGSGNVFKDTYVFEFLNLPEPYSESELQKGILTNLRKFIIEFGRDFSFVGEYYRVQVGGNDYYIDLLFYHRELQCLVAIELKIDDFKPEYIGKMNFYLEALDRDVKKENENPSVGLILCKSKNSEVVEYALSRNMSPTMISEYKTKLIDKKLLESKLHEFFDLVENKK